MDGNGPEMPKLGSAKLVAREGVVCFLAPQSSVIKVVLEYWHAELED